MSIYELLHDIITPNMERLVADVFTEEKYNELSAENDKKIFELLKKISSLGVNYNGAMVDFSPYFEFRNGERTFTIQDLTDEDYAILYSLEMNKLPLLLQVRISDILWTEKKEYRMALLAAKCCYELYIKFFDSQNWIQCFSFIDHAIGLATQINAKKELGNYLQDVFDKIIELNGEDTSFFSIRLIELLVSQKWKMLNDLIPIIDNIISKSANNIYKSRQAFELKTKIYNKLNNANAATENNICLAKYLEANAVSKSKDSFQSLCNAEKYLQEAINIYRNNGAAGESKRLLSYLLDVQKEIPKHMAKLSVTKDVTYEYQKVQEKFSGLSFKESIVRLVLHTILYDKDFLKSKVLNNLSLVSSLFGEGLKTAQGQTIIKIQPIDISNPEANIEILEMHMHRKAIKYEELYGSTVLKWAMDMIDSNLSFSENDLQFIVKNNPIIPAGREKIFSFALYQGLIGNLYVSLHILAPQVENLFRYVAECAGANMSTLKYDDTSDMKLLKSVFDAPELIECFDEDILFLFKGMMNEKAGANIRNEIAHGIMSQQKGNSGVARFFFCWVLKLLSFTSKDFYKFLSENNDFIFNHLSIPK